MANAEYVTVLFTDMVGSTALASGLSPAEADDLRQTHFLSCANRSPRPEALRSKTSAMGSWSSRTGVGRPCLRGLDAAERRRL